jgi:hypothetical protein
VKMGVDGTGSGSFPVASFGVRCVETSGSATRVSSEKNEDSQLIIQMEILICCLCH